MANTWKPIPGAIVFDPEKGQRYVYRNGEWQPIPEWKDEPSPLDDRRELDARADKAMDDASQVMAEAGKEILKLRAMLPDGETRQAIRDLADDAAQTDYDEDNAIDIERVTAWLERLERP